MKKLGGGQKHGSQEYGASTQYTNSITTPNRLRLHRVAVLFTDINNKSSF